MPVPKAGSMNMPQGCLLMVLGDTLYFAASLDTAYGVEMWAYDTSNQSVWLVEDLNFGFSGSYWAGYAGTEFYHNGTMYFSLHAHKIATNCGPTVHCRSTTKPTRVEP